MKQGFTMYGCHAAKRSQDAAALEALLASRPLRPPPLRLEEVRISAAQREAMKAAARGDLQDVDLKRGARKAA